MKTTTGLTFAAAALLSACAALQGPPRPDAAWLSPDRLTVRFKDGSTCRAAIAATGGEGQFTGCGQARYAVTVTAQNPFGRLVPDLFGPYGDIAVTTADGAVTRFRSPLSREPGFDRAIAP